MDLELKGKTALVTGSTRGIGKAISMVLSNEGANLAIVGRSRDRLNRSAKDIFAKTGTKVFKVVADTGEDESVENMIDSVATNFGKIDILVNCAATPLSQVPVVTGEHFNNQLFLDDINVKVMGYIRCIKSIVPVMKKNNGGRIINIAGLASRNVGSMVGSIRNSALVSITKNLSYELGSYGISVCGVHPGYTRTESTEEKILNRSKNEGVSKDQIVSEMRSTNPLGKIIDAYEVANVVAFLCSSKAIAINGDFISAGGGEGKSIYY